MKRRLLLAGVIGALLLTTACSVLRGTVSYNASCITSSEARAVRGSSLSGIVEDGANITVLFRFYDCNPVRRGDIVAYNYSGDSSPIIKVVKGIPGDHLSINGTTLLLNGSVVRNAAGTPYIISERAARMLSLYINDYHGTIPSNACLLLGNLPEGTVDSTRFGLVDKNGILGKAVLT